MDLDDVSVIIPCRNELGAIADVISRVPVRMECVVVDNGSTDGTAEAAVRAGARVVGESRPGYGAAVTAGVLAVQRPVVCTIDGDGSMDPGDLVALVELLDSRADLAVGRRYPVSVGAWPIHARMGSEFAAWQLRRRHQLPVRDIGPMRAIRRDALLELDVRDRRSGYPVELLVRAAQQRLTVVEHPIRYSPRSAGRSKVSGSVAGSWRAGRDFLAALR